MVSASKSCATHPFSLIRVGPPSLTWTPLPDWQSGGHRQSTSSSTGNLKAEHVSVLLKDAKGISRSKVTRIPISWWCEKQKNPKTQAWCGSAFVCWKNHPLQTFPIPRAQQIQKKTAQTHLHRLTRPLQPWHFLPEESTLFEASITCRE